MVVFFHFNRSMKVFILFHIIITLSCQVLYSQNQKLNFEKEYLLADGEIPLEILELASVGLEKSLNKITKSDSIDNFHKIKEFLLTSNYQVSNLFWGGNTLYGDSLTTYVNKVGSKVVKARGNLGNEINFYTYKSSQINAFCTGLGNIFVSTGLLANIENEAELAFVLSHEISHYELKHSLSSYLEEEGILEGEGKYKKQSIEDRVSLLYKFAKSDEFEADSLGAIEFLKMGYRGDNISKVLEMLYYSYLPFDEKYINEGFLNMKEIKIPDKYLLREADSLKSIEERNDRYYTHPNVLKRLSRIEKIVEKNKKENEVDFFFGEKSFYSFQKIARYELVKQYLIEARYSKALYASLTLLQSSPNDKSLEMSISKALYGLCKYKNSNSLHYVAEAYTRIQGESQKIHYLIKHLTRKQFNVIVLSYLERMFKKYPEEAVLEEYINDCIRELVVVNKITKKDLNVDKMDEDNFHLYALGEFFSGGKYDSKFKLYEKELIELIENGNKSYKEKERERVQKAKKKESDGYQIKAKDIVLIEPNVYLVNSKGIMYERIDQLKMEYDSVTTVLCKKNGIQSISLNRFNIKDTKSFNRLLTLKDLIKSYNQNRGYNLITIMDENREYLEETKYVYRVYIYYNKKTKRNHFISSLLDIQSGKEIYSSLKKFKGYPYVNLIQKCIKYDLERIKT